MNSPLSHLPSELQAVVWAHLDSRNKLVFRLLSADSRIVADSRLETIRACGHGPEDVGDVVAFLRAFLERGGRPSALRLELPHVPGRPDDASGRESYALAVLGAFRDAGVTFLRRLDLKELPLSEAIRAAVVQAAPALEELQLRYGHSPLDGRGVAALFEAVGASLVRLVLRDITGLQSTFHEAVGEVVRSAPWLEDLEMPRVLLGRPLAAQLCRLPHLQHLRVEGLSYSITLTPGTPVPLPPALRTLSLAVGGVSASKLDCLQLPSCCTCICFEVLWAKIASTDVIQRALQKLYGRVNGRSLHLDMQPSDLAAVAPELGALELRGLELRHLTPEDLRGAAEHLATVEDLTLSINCAPADLVPLGRMPSLKKLTLDWDESERFAAARHEAVARLQLLCPAWRDEAAVRESLLRLLTSSATLQRLEVDLDTFKHFSGAPRCVSAAVASAAAAVRQQLAAAGRDPAALQVRAASRARDVDC